MKKLIIVSVAAAATLSCATLSVKRSQSLFNGKDLAGWHVDVPKMDNDPSVKSPFIVRDGLLVSLGTPNGHLITDAVYQNLDFIQYHDPAGVLLLSGDHIYQMNYRGIIDYHWKKNADLTIACLKVPLEKAHRFGVAEIDDEDGEIGGRVIRYEEKPAKPEFDWASMTIFCFKPKVLFEVLKANAHEDNSFEFGRDIIPRLMRENRRIYGYKYNGYWGYTRTIDEYWQTSMDLLGPDPKIKLAEWGIRTNLEHRGIRDCQPVKVGASASIQDSLVYNGCVVKGHIERSILFPGVQVEKGAVIKDSVLFFNNIVKKNVHLKKVVSDVNNTFGAGVKMSRGKPTAGQQTTVVGWNNTIPDGTIIGNGSTIYPHLPPGKIPGVIKTGEVVRDES